MEPFHYTGHRPFVQAAASRADIPDNLVAKVAGSVPIGHVGRILVGLSEASHRAGGRPLRDEEIRATGSALLGVEEPRWYYLAAADAARTA